MRCLASSASLALGSISAHPSAVLQMEPRVTWRTDFFRFHTPLPQSLSTHRRRRRRDAILNYHFYPALSSHIVSYPASSVRPYNCRPEPHGCVKDIPISNERGSGYGRRCICILALLCLRAQAGDGAMSRNAGLCVYDYVRFRS